MVMMSSTMLPLGTEAPGFCLPDPQGKLFSLTDFREAPALVVMFLCNHCPFVKHVRRKLVELVKKYQAKGGAFVAISSNDVEAYPEDSREMMGQYAKEYGFTFPYLYDETQEVAKAYSAACTPEFYVFDRERKLVYRGQMDDSRPGNNRPVTGADLRAALQAVLAGKPVSPNQKPSVGCSIKWKPENEPSSFGEKAM